MNPFCAASDQSQWPSVSGISTVPLKTRDYFPLAAQADQTNGGYSQVVRVTQNLQGCALTFVTSGYNVNALLGVLDSNVWANIGDLADEIRPVSTAVRVKYMGPPLYAQGVYRLAIVPHGKDATTITPLTVWPDVAGDVSGKILTVSAQELAQGVTVFLSPTSMEGHLFESGLHTDWEDHCEGLSIFGAGLAASATISLEMNQTWEIVPKIGQRATTMVKPNPSPTSILPAFISDARNKINFVAGGEEVVDKFVYNTAKNVLGRICDYMGVSNATPLFLEL